MKTKLFVLVAALALFGFTTAETRAVSITADFSVSPNVAAPNEQVELKLVIGLSDRYLSSECATCYILGPGNMGSATITDGQGNSSLFNIGDAVGDVGRAIFDTNYTGPGNYLATYTASGSIIGALGGLPGYTGPGISLYFPYSFIGSASVLVTPLPAALPLFATGLGVLGLLGWRRKWKTI